MQKTRGLKRIVLMLVTSMMCAGTFSVHAQAKSNNIKVTAPSGKIVKVAKGKKVKLKTKISNLKNKKVVFKSANPLVAKVTTGGVVKGKKEGKTRITVTSKEDGNIKKTIKVIVFKKAAKKIKLNVSEKTLIKGQQFNLKAKVFPKKKASKTVKFISSNKKVATVTKKGLVNAVGVGTANIKVKATDGSKKKSVCKINVVIPIQKVGIKSLKVRNEKSIEIELTAPKKIEPEDFKVYFKYLAKDKYSVELYVSDVYTQDNIHYEVVVNGLEYSTYVKVVINSLEGVNSKEIVIDEKYPSEDTDAWYGSSHLIDGNVVNSYIVGELGKSVFLYAFSSSMNIKYSYPIKMKVSNLPKGVHAVYSTDGTGLHLTGSCDEKLNGYKTVISGVDAKGKKIYHNVYFYIGDEDTAYAKALDGIYVAYTPAKTDNMSGEAYYTPSVFCTDSKDNQYNAYGGWTDFEAAGLPANVEITESGTIRVKDSSKAVKPGTYNILITAITSSGRDVIIRYKLTLVEGVVISGKITDATGNPYLHNKFYLNSNSNQDGRYKNYAIGCDENGNYSIRVVPGFYNVYSWNFYDSYQNDFTKSRKYDFKSNYYGVEFTSNLLNSVDDKMEIFSIEDIIYRNDQFKKDRIIAYSTSKYNVNTSKLSTKVYAYLRKGHSYTIGYYRSSVENYCNIIVDGVRYVVVPKEIKFTGQKSISIEFEEI